MTEAQASVLCRLCREAGEPFDAQLSKAHASQQIEDLQRKLGKVAEAPRILMGEQTDG